LEHNRFMFTNEIADVRTGHTTPVFQKLPKKKAADIVHLSFSLITKTKQMDLVAGSVEARNEWVEFFKYILPGLRGRNGTASPPMGSLSGGHGLGIMVPPFPTPRHVTDTESSREGSQNNDNGWRDNGNTNNNGSGSGHATPSSSQPSTPAGMVPRLFPATGVPPLSSPSGGLAVASTPSTSSYYNSTPSGSSSMGTPFSPGVPSTPQIGNNGNITPSFTLQRVPSQGAGTPMSSPPQHGRTGSGNNNNSMPYIAAVQTSSMPMTSPTGAATMSTSSRVPTPSTAPTATPTNAGMANAPPYVGAVRVLPPQAITTGTPSVSLSLAPVDRLRSLSSTADITTPLEPFNATAAPASSSSRSQPPTTSSSTVNSGAPPLPPGRRASSSSSAAIATAAASSVATPSMTIPTKVASSSLSYDRPVPVISSEPSTPVRDTLSTAVNNTASASTAASSSSTGVGNDSALVTPSRGDVHVLAMDFPSLDLGFDDDDDENDDHLSHMRD
jgi:hypothetical protein